MAIKKVCVIGSGTMGNGITQVVAQAGYETTMVDVKQEFIDKGMNAIKASLGRFVEKGKIGQADTDKALANISTSIDLKQAAKDADYVIEAVFERVDIKLPVYQQLEEICPKQTILSSNTSGIPISLLASATKRPDKVIGMHFFSPVPVMRGLEVVKSLLTSEETLKVSLDFGKSIGKETVVVKDSPAFVSNRIITLVLNEGAKMLEENLASMEDIDKIIKLSFNWPMGPFELNDLVGIDVAVDLLEGIYQQTGWERYKPARLLKRMVEIGYLGRKTGKGFYTLFGTKQSSP
ncbi:MAG: 3-hydroxyacyl-CoA dehydrogenase family protein [Chloroflexi bacterium]|nr:3-hydroxyacyl-CoA dehydrogenase family protein [Chloroflexota bacterium]